MGAGMPLPLYPALVSYVAQHMRACDAAEVWPVLDDHITPADIGAALHRASQVGGVFLHDDIPACAVGAARQHPGVWSGWMFATDAFPHVWRQVYRYARPGGEMERELLALGAHRLHVASIDGHPDAGRLLTALGFVREGPSRWFGKGREDYSLWARFAPEAV